VTFLYADQAVEPVVAGTDHTLFQPQAGEWHLRFEGNGLAYYRQADENMADVSLYVDAPENTSLLGEEVAIRAGLTANGTPVTDLTPFAVTATIHNALDTLDPLELALDCTSGLFAATAPADRFTNGTYTVTLTAQSSIPNLSVQPAAGHFEMVALPTLVMTTTPVGPIRPGQSVHVIVTVENWRPGYIPRLQLYGPDTLHVITPTWTVQETGVFASTVTTPPDVRSSFAIAAQLVQETATQTDETFGTIQTTPQIVEYAAPSLTATIVRALIWLLGLLCVALAVAGFVWWHSANKHKRQRRRRIKRLRNEVEALGRIVGEIPEDQPSTIVESWRA
jgi:hypothetical protein